MRITHFQPIFCFLIKLMNVWLKLCILWLKSGSFNLLSHMSPVYPGKHWQTDSMHNPKKQLVSKQAFAVSLTEARKDWKHTEGNMRLTPTCLLLMLHLRPTKSGGQWQMRARPNRWHSPFTHGLSAPQSCAVTAFSEFHIYAVISLCVYTYVLPKRCIIA